MGYYQHDLVWKIRTFADKFGLLPRGEPVVVGVSGGPDSLCLLHALMALAPEYGLVLHAAHLNHQLRGADSDQDAQFVQELATKWGIPCMVETCDVADYAQREKLAIEEAARQCRYGFLAQVAARVGAATIAVGHNADDQAESVLMHFIRGSGLAGLRGMLPLTRISDYKFQISNFKSETRVRVSTDILDLKLIRPLLEIPRAEIEVYCQQNGIEPRFDRSNLDTTYFRNWLRHTLLPLMETHNPGVDDVLRRTASVAAADYELLHNLMQQAWPRVVRAESERAITFDLAAWRELPLSLRRAMLREAIHRLRRTLRNINFVHVEDALELALRGQTGDRATLPEGLMLTLSYDAFVVASAGHEIPWPDLPLLEPDTALNIEVPGQTFLPNSSWALEAELQSEILNVQFEMADPWEVYLDANALEGSLILRTRQPGDRLAPLGMDGHTKALRDVFIHAKIPQAWRERMPILVSGQRIVWACGVQVAHDARVTSATQRVLHVRFAKVASGE
jgi:tRNA(Ile)-lysidine synthase